MSFDATNALKQLDAAAAAGKLTPHAVKNIRTWLTEPYLAEFAPQVAEHIAGGKWPALEEAFWTTIPFGTGGRRGRLYPIGCNAINDRTIGESAQGLADYVREQAEKAEKTGTGSEHGHVGSAKAVAGEVPVPVSSRTLSCAIAYDTRHRSREFAELCSAIMVANGYKVWFLDGYRSTPALSFTVRHKQCDCGIMITASHNPPTDNAVKVYWSTGGQLLPPHDTDSIARMQSVTWIKRADFAEALAAGKVEYCQGEIDAAFVAAVVKQSQPGPRDVRIIYSPLHGVGASAVMPVLAAAGFRNVELYGPHAEPSPDFPNVPNHVSNPENAAVFDAIIDHARLTGAELILATDPDCDRLGCAAPLHGGGFAPWGTLNGNQQGALLTDFLLGKRKAAGTLRPELYIVKTLVTTELMRRIADDYGVQTSGNHQVGFKYIGGEIDRLGPEGFVIGAEESYGFLVGAHARDKDAAVAAMLIAELAADLKAKGLTLHERLDDLYGRYGVHSESQLNIQMPGEKGMDDMRALMQRFRTNPPRKIAGMRVVRLLDYAAQTITTIGGKPQPFDGANGDMVTLELDAPGNAVAVRPSGTEPKVKFYMFACDAPSAGGVEATRAAQRTRMAAMEKDLQALTNP